MPIGSLYFLSFSTLVAKRKHSLIGKHQEFQISRVSQWPSKIRKTWRNGARDSRQVLGGGWGWGGVFSLELSPSLSPSLMAVFLIQEFARPVKDTQSQNWKNVIMSWYSYSLIVLCAFDVAILQLHHAKIILMRRIVRTKIPLQILGVLTFFNIN